jgi:putative FmdB family regulatory protein
MPIYEYTCNRCDSKFEMMRPFSQSTSSADCPTCRKPANRIMSTFASFSVGEGGSVAPVAGTSGGCSCGSCGGGSCSTCGAG